MARYVAATVGVAKPGGCLARLEEALADESGGPRGHVLPIPEGQREPTDDDADGDDPLADLRGDLVRLRGALALVETMASGYGDKSAGGLILIGRRDGSERNRRKFWRRCEATRH